MKLELSFLGMLRSRCISAPNIIYYSTRSIKPNRKCDEPDLPEYIYAGKNVKPHTRIYMMGVSSHGALGDRRFLRPEKGKKIFEFVQRPYRLDFAENHKVDEVACGYGYTVLGVKSKDGSPAFYGTGVATNCQIGFHSQRERQQIKSIIEPNPIGIPLSKQCQMKKISCGRAHTIIWTDTEGLWTFGNNSYGQCGRPVIEKESYSLKAHFHQVKQFDTMPIEQVECGQDTSFVLSNGTIYSCGWSADGQTGRETYQNMDEFGPVLGDLKGEKIIKISSKADCILALTENGDVFGWGNSEYRQLGSITDEQQTNSPRKLKLNIVGKVVDIAAAGTSCFALTDSGDVWSWGYGILGRGPDNRSSVEPQCIPSTLLGRNILNPDSKVQKIYAGVTSAAALTNNGNVFAWGRNIGGCLGLGHTKFQHFPMRICVTGIVSKVSLGVDHTALLAKSLM